MDTAFDHSEVRTESLYVYVKKINCFKLTVPCIVIQC